jgi:hypothetical protein
VGSVIYVGGSFSSATDSTGTFARHNLAAVSATTGRLLGWRPSTNAAVLALVATKDKVYAGGNFTRANGHAVSRLIELNRRHGTLVRKFSPRVNKTVQALAVGPVRVFAGGKFTSVNGHRRIRLAAFGRSSYKLAAWAPRANSAVRVLRRKGTHVYVGGAFRSINGVAHTGRAAVVTAKSGSVYRAFHSPISYLVNDIRFSSNRVLFAVAGPGGRVVSTGPKGKVAWRRVFDGDVDALAVLDKTVYVGGHFVDHCTSNRVVGPGGACRDGKVRSPRLAATTMTGSFKGWAPSADVSNGVGVLTMATVPGLHSLVAGGAFNTFHDKQSQPKFAIFRTR